ncbi:snaclec bothroinsularin subunit beta-like [Drosophila hydei]|uniref:Snaclec bothroinsularin subunit beta-like n=1 Tax=Drosophila hydei TaxID=7224 RepID=A0A6J2SXU9_DROHY|nr:snaclec bothroinsularin subunit beta-like [Drosophila hydei]
MKALALGLCALFCVVAWADLTEVDALPSSDDEDAAQPVLALFTYANTQYGLSLNKLTWYEAQLFCAEQEYVLANIPSESMQTTILNFIQSSAVDELSSLVNEPIWVSGTNQGLGTQYVWHSSGARFTYRNFLRNPSSGYRCVAINGLTGDWTDESCRDRHYFVCELQPCVPKTT